LWSLLRFIRQRSARSLIARLPQSFTNVPEPGTSVRHKEQLIFWIDDEEKNLLFADGDRLHVTRFDQSWISGDRDDIRYEFNRSDGTLSFAGTTSQGSATTTVLGSGHCESADKT